MSAAGSAAATGAASGAATGMMLGPWGAAAGAVIGGAAGYFQGMGADKKRKAQEKVMEQLRQAEGLHRGNLERYAQEDARLGREVTEGGQTRFSEHVQGFDPRDVAGGQRALSEGYGQTIQGGMGPAPAGGAYPQQYSQRAYADQLARARAQLDPRALQGARADIGQAEAFRGMDYAQGELPDAQRMTDRRSMGAVQRAMSHEEYAAALARAGLAGQQAERAGSREMLTGGLIQSAGNLGLGVAGSFTGGAAPTIAEQNPGASTYGGGSIPGPVRPGTRGPGLGQNIWGR